MSDPLCHETIWFDKARVEDAEKNYYERLSGCKEQKKQTPPAEKQLAPKSSLTPVNSIADEIARVRQHIKHSLQSVDSVAPSINLDSRIQLLEKKNKELENVVKDLNSALAKMESRLAALEKGRATANGVAPATKAVVKESKSKVTPSKTVAKDEDDDLDLFGSDEEGDKEANDLRDKRLQEYAAKKSKKPALVAKSSVVLDVKPWDDETNMAWMEKQVRAIQMDGLTWGASKLVPLAYGIKKLQIGTVVEDDKVSIDLLQEKIEELEDLVQSVDIAAFNKL